MFYSISTQDTETGDITAPVLSPAVSYKDNGEDSRVWDVLTRSPILCTDPGLELESGDTISDGSFCAGAGLVLLATCLSSDLGWVSCTVQHCTALYTVHSWQLSALQYRGYHELSHYHGHWPLLCSCTQPPYSCQLAAVILLTVADCQNTAPSPGTEHDLLCVWCPCDGAGMT